MFLTIFYQMWKTFQWGTVVFSLTIWMPKTNEKYSTFREVVPEKFRKMQILGLFREGCSVQGGGGGRVPPFLARKKKVPKKWQTFLAKFYGGIPFKFFFLQKKVKLKKKKSQIFRDSPKTAVPYLWPIRKPLSNWFDSSEVGVFTYEIFSCLKLAFYILF